MPLVLPPSSGRSGRSSNAKIQGCVSTSWRCRVSEVRDHAVNHGAPPDPMHAAHASVNCDPSQQQSGGDGGSNDVDSQATVPFDDDL